MAAPCGIGSLAIPYQSGTRLEIAEQIASALAAAHAAGVIHRDVKPENVMLRPDGLVKVLDFGLAKLDPAVAFNGAQSTRTALSTHGDIVMGTSIYMSPEQARGEPLDARTDIFSLGAVLYEMVTGRQAFVGNSTAVVYDGILNRMPLPAMNLNPQVRPGLQDIINKALEKSRDLRYQFASELRTDSIRFGRDTDWDGGAVRQTDTAWLTRRSPGRPRQAAIILALFARWTTRICRCWVPPLAVSLSTITPAGGATHDELI